MFQRRSPFKKAVEAVGNLVYAELMIRLSPVSQFWLCAFAALATACASERPDFGVGEAGSGGRDGEGGSATGGTGGKQASPEDAGAAGSRPNGEGGHLSPAPDPDICRKDEYVDDNTCVDCPAGSTNAAGDDAAGDDTSCNPVLCAEDEHVDDNSCVACPAGSANTAGDDASGDDTSCDGTDCPSNQRVENMSCVDCPAGTTNAAGDDPAGPNTSCDATLCAFNQRVENKSCVDCPAGTTNAAGDDAAGANTVCGATLCAENEFVQSNACVSCPAGTTNAAGDNASGSNTECLDACAQALGAANCEAYVKASNTGELEYFGSAVALYGDTLVVGAEREGSNATGLGGDENNDFASESGAVYVFVRSGSTWTQQAYIKASNTGAYDQFGVSVALDGDTLAVGAYGEDSNSTWIGGDQTNNSTESSGAVYVFKRSGSTWTQQAYIKASNAGQQDYFGGSVALSGNTLAVGAYGEDSNATGIAGNQSNNIAPSSGAVYVFVRSGSSAWSQQAYIKASNAEASDLFGGSVAVDGDTLAVGANRESSNATVVGGDQTNNSASGSGAVYLFKRSGSTWSQQAYIKASNAEAEDQFGIAVALDGDTLAVGAEGEDSNATGVDGNQANNSASGRGAAYVFFRSGPTWTQQAYIKASNTGLAKFGGSLALDGDTLVVGAEEEHSNATGVDGNQSNNDAISSGAAYVFRRSGSTWAHQAYIKAFNTDSSDWFGDSVALDGDTLAVGAFEEDSNATGVDGDQNDNSAQDSGAAYVYRIAL
ncbi:MAG: hypothetical protein RJA70_122 [Pseudomonadota bacterium]|jgi:hypothetical protein